MSLRFLSVCSGIEAASVAWKPLGFEAAAFAEIDRFPSAVLAHRQTDVPNFGDMTQFMEWPDANIDLLVGGTPCQSFSGAGLRKGLDDPRGRLMLVYLAIARRYRPRWLVWENVPGVLSIDDGRAFGTLLGGLAILGYGFAYRILDAQYFGLAQRRKRVFVVGHLGDWRRAAAVLFERESLSGHPAPRRETGQGVAPTIAARTRGGGGLGTDFDCDGGIVASQPASIPSLSMCLNAGAMGRIDAESETLIPIGGSFDVAHTLRAEGFDLGSDGTEVFVPVAFDTTQITSATNRCNSKPGDPCHPLAAGAHAPEIAFQESQSGLRSGPSHPTLDSHNGSRRHHGVMAGMGVRRLTPRECERLQGFPDDYTLIPYRGKPAKDGPRYKALGNSMAVPVMAWIGQRIQMVEGGPA